MPFRESGWNMEITVIKRTQVMKTLLLTISARRYGKVNSTITATTSFDPNITSDPNTMSDPTCVRSNMRQIQHASDPTCVRSNIRQIQSPIRLPQIPIPQILTLVPSLRQLLVPIHQHAAAAILATILRQTPPYQIQIQIIGGGR
jgi:hypothetical protein